MLNISCKMGNVRPETEKRSEGGSFYSELSRVHCHRGEIDLEWELSSAVHVWRA